MHVVFCGTGWLEIVDYIRARLPPNVRLSVRDPATPMCDAVRDAQVVIPSNAHVGAEELAAGTELVLIQQSAAGYDVVDLDAARGRDVPVCNAPDTNAAALAEAALLLMLALARRFPRETDRAIAGRRLGEPLGVELSGRTLGVVGMGASGRRLAEAARALGMTVAGVTSTSARADFEALLAASDVVSIHCPLTERTRGLFDGAAFERLRRGAFVVNCARGPIIDRDALVRALDDGVVRGVGLDVHWSEPCDPTDPFYARTDVVALPHVGGATEEAYARIADIVVDNIRRVRDGQPLRHRVA